MAVVSACPDVSVLQQLALGRMTPHEVEHLAKHCEQCPRCIELLHAMKAEDTLIAAIASQGTTPNQSSDASVNSLIERLKNLPSPTSSSEMTTPLAGAVVAGEVVDPTLAGDIALAPAQAADEIGRLGGYRVLKILGAGGMGMVYHAEDTHLQRPIALKVMKPEVARNPLARERFLREARAAAKLKSDHVVNIYQVGEERQVVFFAMELLEGMSLEDWLKKGRAASLAQAARIGRQIALGMADAHACGLVHRDIKPGNIWLDSRHQGRVKLLDFGLARGDNDEHQLTRSGAIVGTPAYMAPEQARGEYVDPRCDLFSLGVVLYRLTTGQLPFHGDNTMSVLTSLALDTPRSPREINADIPPRMAALIERLLAKRRAERPATAKAVADELAAIEREAEGERTVQVRAATVRERSAPTAPSRSRLRWLVAASLLLLLGGVSAAIVVIIRDKDGNKITEIDVPPGGSVETKDKENAKAKATPKEEEKIVAAPLAAMLAGEALSPSAFVRHPAKLPGVRAWSIEQRNPFWTNAIAYRPDSQQIAAADYDGRIRILDAKSGRLVQLLLGQNGLLRLVWSPDGRKLATYGIDAPNHNVIRIWEAESGRVLPAPEAFSEGRIDAFVWSFDGRTLRALQRGVGCLIWDAATGKLLRKIEERDLQIPADFSTDGKRLFAATASSAIVLWDVDSGKEIRRFPECKGRVLALACSLDGKYLAASSASDQGVLVWEVESGKEIVSRKDLFNCSNLCWSPDGKGFLSAHGTHNGTCIRITKVESPAKSQTLEDSAASSIAWAPDGKTIAWALTDWGRVRLYDVERGKQLWSLSEEVEFRSIALAADGRTLAVKGWNNESPAVLASMDNGQALAKVKGVQAPVALSPDGKRLAVQGPNGSLWLYEDNGKIRVPLQGHIKPITWLAWSPQGRILASASYEDKRVILWDVEKGERLRELGPFTINANENGRWTPDGRLFAFHTPDNGWQIWDVEQNKLLNDPKQWNGVNLSLYPNGRLAVVTPDRRFQIKEIATAKTLASYEMWVRGGAAVSPDGRMLALSHHFGVELWRGDLRRRLRTLEASNLHLVKLDFSSDGKLVLGQEAGSRLHVWETDTGRRRGIVFLGEQNNSLTLAADGHYNGTDQVERGIVAVVQKDDGTQEVLEPADFEAKYGWKNDPNKVHLLQPLPPLLYPQPGQPMGPNALVREPAPLPEVNSWTVETLSARSLVRAVAYRPDGKRLATGGCDGTIRIWDTSTGELVRMLSAEAKVYHLSWSRDGGILAANCADGVARFWDADTGRWRLRLRSSANSFFWPPDGRSVAVTDPSSIRFYDLATGKLLRSIDLLGYSAPCAWSSDGKRLAFVVQNDLKTLRVLDTETGKEIHRLEGHADQIYCVAWSPDGKRLASGGRFDSGFRLWDAVAGKLLKQFPVENVWANTTRALAWSPDGKAVALGFSQGPHGLYDVETGRPLHTFWGHEVTAVAVSPDGKQAAIADSFGVRLNNNSTGKLAYALEKMNTKDGIRSLAWSPDNRRLVVGIGEGVLLDAATGKHELSLPEAWHSAVWSADGKMMATAGVAGIRLWDATTYRRVRDLEEKEPPPTLLAWSPDGKRLAAGDNQRIRVWETATGKLLWRSDKFGAVFSLVWSPDGRRLAAEDMSDKTQAVRIFHGDTGELQVEASLTWESQTAWSPDGKTLAAGPTEQGECLLIDVESGKVRVKAPAKGGRHHIRAIRWAADGSTFSTLDRGQFQRVFDAVTGKQLRTRPIDLPYGEYRWSPDGKVLACRTLYEIQLYDEDFWPLGTFLPGEPFAPLAVTTDGHHRGNVRVERQIRMVVQKRDGTTETLTPREFEQKYNFKNEFDKVRLLDK